MLSVGFKTALSHARLGAVFACVLGAPATAQTDVELNDLAARVQYAYYSADVSGLKQSLAQLEQLQVQGAANALKQNYMAYGAWKLAETTVASDKEAAATAAERCADTAEPAAHTDLRAGLRADLYALQSACLNLLADWRSLRSPLYKRKRDQSMTEALQQAPKNPRVLLMSALLKAEDDKTAELAHQQLLNAIQVFAEETPNAGRPDWGYPEALARLGALELARGNALEARNALERALVLAPDYRWAQSLLQKTVVR